MSETSLTICTVSYESGGFVEANLRLTRAMNPGSAVAWRVAENSPAGSDAAVDPALDVDLRPGVPVPSVRYQAASYHHGMALNELLPGIDTRHVLVIDPDFFVISPGWVDACRHHVTECGLAFFGAPWHPRWVTKPRGFPSPHFLWIDGARVDVPALDFLPDGDKAPWEQVFQVSRRRRRADRMLAHVVPEWMERRKVGRSRDTGMRVHDRYAAATGVELLVPYYDAARHRPGGRGSAASRLADRLMPPGLRLVPPRGTYTGRGFAERGLPDLDARGWEEFVWRDQPFGFHVRGYPLRGKAEPAIDPAHDVVAVLEQVCRAAGKVL